MQLEDNQACNYVNCWRLTSILQQSDGISGELLTLEERGSALEKEREIGGVSKIDEQLRLVSLSNNENTVVQQLKRASREEAQKIRF